jgi:DNA-binding winged helix-turn-helix (wHTH) protein/tetratricopeptide (TPR) repeat protein
MKAGSEMKVFQPFRLDSANYCLWRSDERVAITPKAFDVLRYLVDRPQQLVSQNEILEALWPETYVNPEVVKKYILELRRVLKDDADKPHFIETVPKRGYRFVAPVSDEGAATTSDASGDANREFVGRKIGLASLEEYLGKALHGQRQVIFVTGDAGIGKTTMVDTFSRRAASGSNLRIARGQCVEGFGGKEAYYPLLEAVGQLLREFGNTHSAQKWRSLAPTWLIQFPSLVSPEQRESLQRDILGATRERMVREICEVLEAVTAEGPLLLILEDLHWVDPSTLDVISAVARRRSPTKLMVLGTYRPVDVVISGNPLRGLKQDLLVHGLCEEIALESLDEAEIADYLAALFGGHQLPAGLAGLVHRHSAGNPLFVTLIVQDMVKRGIIAESQGIWTLTADLEELDFDVPDTLQQILMLQFEQLNAPEQLILRSASVAGDYFSVWAIAGTLKLEPEQIEQLCEDLAERHQFIRPAGFQEYPDGAASPRYGFKHSLYRHALYRGLSDVARTRLHRSLACRLATAGSPGEQEMTSELAAHFEQGREFGEAIRCWRLTADRAAKRFAHRDSIQVLQHALKLVPELSASLRIESEIELLQRIGDAHYALGAISDSALAYETAAARAADGGLKLAQVNALASLAVPAWYSDPEYGNAVSQKAVEVSQSLADPMVLAEAQLAAANFRLVYDAWRSEDYEMCKTARETIRRLGAGGRPESVFYPYVQLALGEYRDALKNAEARMTGTPGATDFLLALGAKIAALLHLGRFGEVLQILQTRRKMAEQNGEDPWVFIFREAWLRTLCFDFEGARSLSRIIMHSNAEQHAVQPGAIAMLASGYAELNQGKYDAALDCFSRVRDFGITRKFFLHWRWRLSAHLGSCRVLLRAGRIAEARRETEDLLKSVLDTVDPEFHALAWEMKARVAMKEKDWNSAGHCVEAALAVMERYEVPLVAWRVHATAWDLYRIDDQSRGDQHLRMAKELIMKLANSFAPGEHLRDTFLDGGPVSRVVAANVNTT